MGESTYEKDMMAILHVVESLLPHLIGRHFQIKIDITLSSIFGIDIAISKVTQMDQ